MKLMILSAMAAGAVALVAPPAAEARQGCGVGFHRGPAGACRPNVRGGFYRGYGYWDGHRYWRTRYRYHGGWRYR